MKTWQRYWLYGVVIFFSVHLVRDIMQDLQIHNLLSDIMVKSDLSKTPSWYWQIFNTYLIETAEILLAGYCLKRGKFGFLGYLTIFITVFFITVWSFYWIFL